MTTSIHVNVALAVGRDGNPYVIYSAADQITAQCLCTETGDIHLMDLPKSTVKDSAVTISFSLLTAHLRLGPTGREVYFCFDMNNQASNIDVEPATTLKSAIAVLPVNQPSPGPGMPNAGFSPSRTTSTMSIQFSDDNRDGQTYQYTLWLTSNLPVPTWFKLDPRIINQKN